ncbi:protein PSK SIMULATOR 1-like [Malania oleifera]|uniref:protein PSK SIMULATOR 1-like n=1 Tax=Malania oleifera TaxID=397392 RepID=UPI0025ADB91C|nr:protein PSK SIMULATOR 1-like [Malania oleifera]
MAATTMAWLSDVKRSLSADSRRNGNRRSDKPATLGILAFDTAKIMSRLVSLHKSLSDDEIFKLRKEVMRSKGVSYLNSKDPGFLLYLACAEILEDLDSTAIAIARLGRKCSNIGLSQFDLVYSDLKMGIIDLSKLKFASRDVDKVFDKMEKFVSATANLFSSLESLSEMEISEKKLQVWKKNMTQKTNFDLFDTKIAWQRKQVRMFRDLSLWSQTFDKTVALMSRAACFVYTRVCLVFGPYISVLPSISNRNLQYPPYQQMHIRALPENGRASKSGPIAITPKQKLTRVFSRKSSLLVSDDIGFGVGFGIGYDDSNNFGFGEMGKHNSVFRAAPPSTLGGSGLALRYANVIILAERYLNAPAAIVEDARANLYEMLPARLRASVTAKLRRRWRREEEGEEAAVRDGGPSLAEGWREAMKEILQWLGPVAHDTVKWQAGRNMEKQMFEGKPTVLLLQTLHYSDREKTEAAIAELLVGLSCVHICENRRAFDRCRYNNLCR